MPQIVGWIRCFKPQSNIIIFCQRALFTFLKYGLENVYKSRKTRNKLQDQFCFLIVHLSFTKYSMDFANSLCSAAEAYLRLYWVHMWPLCTSFIRFYYSRNCIKGSKQPAIAFGNGSGYVCNALSLLVSSDVHRLDPGSSEPIPGFARFVRPLGRGALQSSPSGRDCATHLRRGQRVLPVAVEEAAEPVCPHQVTQLLPLLSHV